MKTIFALASLFVMAFSTGAMAQTRITIGGYDDGLYLLDTAQKTQLMTQVVIPIDQKLSDVTDGTLVIEIDGNASRTGTEAANQKIAEDRATQVRDFLLRSFPNAKFSALTNGDQTDSRTVIVSWKIEPIRAPLAKVPPTVKTNGWSFNRWSVTMISRIGIIALCFLLFMRRRKSEDKPQQELSSIESAPVASSEPITKLITIKLDGFVCTVRTILDETGSIILPFPRTQGSEEMNRRKDERAAQICFKMCLKDKHEIYQQVTERLIADGTLTKEKL